MVSSIAGLRGHPCMGMVAVSLKCLVPQRGSGARHPASAQTSDHAATGNIPFQAAQNFQTADAPAELLTSHLSAIAAEGLSLASGRAPRPSFRFRTLTFVSQNEGRTVLLAD